MAVYALGDLVPDIDPSAFVHPDATVVGRVRIGAESTIWPQTVLRGDYGRIEVGERTSVQDGSVIHCTARHPTIIGNDVVIGHLVHMEGCTIEDWALVGSGSVVLHGCVVHPHSVVAANAVCLDGLDVPTGAIAAGVPAKIKPDRVAPFATSLAVALYVENGKRYRQDLRRVD